MPSRSKRITASQVGQYAFCARAWWLAVVEGQQPDSVEALDAGVRTHERHGWQVSLARTLSKVALVLLGLTALVLLVWAISLLK